VEAAVESLRADACLYDATNYEESESGKACRAIAERIERQMKGDGK
jgi:hypothetical protein